MRAIPKRLQLRSKVRPVASVPSPQRSECVRTNASLAGNSSGLHEALHFSSESHQHSLPQFRITDGSSLATELSDGSSVKRARRLTGEPGSPRRSRRRPVAWTVGDSRVAGTQRTGRVAGRNIQRRPISAPVENYIHTFNGTPCLERSVSTAVTHLPTSSSSALASRSGIAEFMRTGSRRGRAVTLRVIRLADRYPGSPAPQTDHRYPTDKVVSGFSRQHCDRPGQSVGTQSSTGNAYERLC